jgi:hypothetical protein
MVYVQGSLWKRGVDYTEVNLGTTNTNQILVADGFIGGEDIVMLPAYQAIDQTSASSSLANQSLASLQSMMTAGSQGFVDQSSDMISVPNTAIVGRAKIPNLANDLRASLGIERIPVQSTVQLQNEFGASGEPVLSVVNDDRGLIRVVGGGSVTSSDGSYAYFSDGYAEITFYGTGLNFIMKVDSSNRSLGVYVDGVYDSVVNITGGSVILNARNYASNVVVSAKSGLSLGLHTIKITSSSGNQISMYGVEILNANASGLVNINTGTGYINGQKYVNSLVDSVAYNTGVTGIRGGRVVRYLNSDGTVGQAFTAVDTLAKALSYAGTGYAGTAADHTNEEVVRTYHWREFGCGRVDDFLSTFGPGSSKAFTLDDGTTSLVGNGITLFTPYNAVYPDTTNSFLVFTFVGTGIDFYEADYGSLDSHSIIIDGVTVWTGTTGFAASGIRKVASGLPYGTHTVKILRNGTGIGGMAIRQFIVYGPKKPTIPATALELCDYNVMSNYTASVSSDFAIPPSGALRKANTREVLYYNTWVGPTLASAVPSGFTVVSNTASSYWQLTYFGYGVELLGAVDTLAVNQTVSIDDSSVLTGSTLIQPGTGLVWTAATGTLSGTSTVGGNIRIIIPVSTLSAHKVKLLVNSGYYTYQHAIDIITPIHSTKSNLYADLQNTLPVGSCSLMDSRKTSMIKEILPSQKAWAQAVGVAAAPSTSSAVLVPMPDMSCTIKTSGGAIEVSYNMVVYHPTTGHAIYSAIYVDGLKVSSTKQCHEASANFDFLLGDSMIIPVSPGVHKVDIYWMASIASAYGEGALRNLTVKEL